MLKSLQKYAITSTRQDQSAARAAVGGITSSSRRKFLATIAALVTIPSVLASGRQSKRNIMTVRGPIAPADMGVTLIHEHILVDFVGALDYDPKKWDREVVVKKMLPFLQELRKTGCKTLIDCTPNYLGRDAVLLQWLSELTDLNIITNTGYYGGSDNKFLPEHFFQETPEQLAKRWVDEWKDGIERTAVRPGFIKISVNPGKLSDVSKKLVQAAAITHLQTGLSIASHTGPAIAALEEIELLRSAGVAPEAFIWVHAQNEKDFRNYLKAGNAGAWISLDGLNDENVSDYADRIAYIKKNKLLRKLLVSHDAGWYDPAKPDGGDIRGYTTLFEKLLPALKQRKINDADITQLLQTNPRNAFEIRIRGQKQNRR